MIDFHASALLYEQLRAQIDCTLGVIKSAYQMAGLFRFLKPITKH